MQHGARNTAHTYINTQHGAHLHQYAEQYFRVQTHAWPWLAAAVVGPLGHVIRTGHALAITLTPAARRHCFAAALHERLCMPFTFNRSMFLGMVLGFVSLVRKTPERIVLVQQHHRTILYE